MFNKKVGLLALVAVSSLALTGCDTMRSVTENVTETVKDTMAGSKNVYRAEMQPLNTLVTGTEAHGTASLRVQGDKLVINIEMTGVPANMVHWQHFHGFKAGTAASCATQADDANGDGIVDLIETERLSGTTMVPFNDAPEKMDIPNGVYPTASATGTYKYRQEVDLGQLQAAFGKAYNGQALALGERVIYIHGVPDTTRLPTTVKSLGPIPAQVTLPIACGKLVQG